MLCSMKIDSPTRFEDTTSTGRDKMLGYLGTYRCHRSCSRRCGAIKTKITSGPGGQQPWEISRGEARYVVRIKKLFICSSVNVIHT